MNPHGLYFAAPSSVLTRPNNTTAYAQNDLIASSTTAGSIVVPSFGVPVSQAQAVFLRRARLLTNKGSGMTSFQGHVDLWSAAPTFPNGDNGAYGLTTGAAGWLGDITFGVMSQGSDGAYAAGKPDSGTDIGVAIAPGDLIYWSLKEVDATGFTPAANQTFTLIPELYYQ